MNAIVGQGGVWINPQPPQLTANPPPAWFKIGLATPHLKKFVCKMDHVDRTKYKEIADIAAELYNTLKDMGLDPHS